VLWRGARRRRLWVCIAHDPGSIGVGAHYPDSRSDRSRGASPLVSGAESPARTGSGLTRRRRYRYFRTLAGATLRRGCACQDCRSVGDGACECPHHLVDVISSLNAFETYSQECDVLNVDDAALHAFLHSATAQARSLLETALARVMDADAIEIEDEDRWIGTGRTTRVAGQNARRGGVGRIRTRRQTEKRRGAGAGTDTTVMPKQSLPLHNVTRDLS